MAAALIPGLGERLNQEDFIRSISSYLNLRNLKVLRQVSRNWNAGIIHSPCFQAKVQGQVDTTWYERIATLRTFSIPRTVEFRSVRMDHFVFRRASGDFKFFWHHSARVLTNLTLAHCKFECDEFKFLLDHCPVLEILKMQNVMLRDLDDYHVEGATPVDEGAAGPEPVPLRAPLRQIIFRSMFRIDNCFMEYLIGRTRGLQAIEMTDCFMADDNNRALGRPKFQEAFRVFLTNFIRLLARNEGTMRKLTLRVNQYQENLLGTLGLAMAGRVLPELHLDLLPDDYRGAIQLLQQSAGVETLSLHFRGRLSNEQLKGALQGLEGTLRRFDLTFNGETVTEQLELGWLANYTHLESLIVRDGKMLKYMDSRRLVGGRRLARIGVFRRRRRFGWGRGQDNLLLNICALLAKVTTRMNPNFLNHLPPSCQQLSIHQFIPKGNIFETRPSDEQIAMYRRLTKLDIHGPWIYSMTGVLNVLVAEMPQLRSLTLSDCGVNDSILTGLSPDTTLEIGRSLTYGLILTPPIPRTPEAVLKVVEDNLRLPSTTTPGNYRGLSGLAHLEHLDLSTNPGISSLSLFYSLRLSKLKTLSLANCVRMSDISLEFLAMFCPNLEVLNVKNCRNLSKFGLNNYISKSKRLQCLYTTPFIKTRDMGGLDFALSPDYDQIVDCTPGTRMEALDKRVDYLERNLEEFNRPEELEPVEV